MITACENIKVDVIQQVLALARDIGASYSNAKPELKQLYLGLFWHHFEAKERKICAAVKSPIVMALEEVGAFNNLENEHIERPVPSSIRRRELSVIETTFGGA